MKFLSTVVISMLLQSNVFGSDNNSKKLFGSLPPQIFDHLMEFLETEDRIRSSSTSRYMNQLMSEYTQKVLLLDGTEKQFKELGELDFKNIDRFIDPSFIIRTYLASSESLRTWLLNKVMVGLEDISRLPMKSSNKSDKIRLFYLELEKIGLLDHLEKSQDPALNLVDTLVDLSQLNQIITHSMFEIKDLVSRQAGNILRDHHRRTFFERIRDNVKAQGMDERRESIEDEIWDEIWALTNEHSIDPSIDNAFDSDRWDQLWDESEKLAWVQTKRLVSPHIPNMLKNYQLYSPSNGGELSDSLDPVIKSVLLCYQVAAIINRSRLDLRQNTQKIAELISRMLADGQASTILDDRQAISQGANDQALPLIDLLNKRIEG